MPTVWPFAPREEIVESIEWRTDVLRAYQTEARHRLVEAPRSRYVLEHTMTPRQYQRARVLAISTLSGEFTMPVWPEKQTVTVSSGATTITIDTTASDYRVGGLAVLWASDESYETVTISAVGAGSLTVSAVGANYTNALCMPGLTVKVVEGFEAQRTVEDHISTSVEFVAYTGKDLANSGLYATTYRSLPLVDDAAVLGSASMAERIQWPQGAVDNALAPPFYDTLIHAPKVSLVMAWHTATMADLWALRGWLHYLKGRQREFWLPEWTAGIELEASIAPADTSLQIKTIGLNAAIEAGDIAVITASGITCFQFTSVTTNGVSDTLNLSAAAGVTINVANVLRTCFVRRVRLAQDTVELVHRNAGNAVHTSVMVSADEAPA